MRSCLPFSHRNMSPAVQESYVPARMTDTALGCVFFSHRKNTKAAAEVEKPAHTLTLFGCVDAVMSGTRSLALWAAMSSTYMSALLMWLADVRW